MLSLGNVPNTASALMKPFLFLARGVKGGLGTEEPWQPFLRDLPSP